MRKTTILLIFTLFVSTIEARTYYDFFDRNKKMRINAANQIIEEILRTEDFKYKERFQEKSYAEAEHIIIEDNFPGEFPEYKSSFYYELINKQDEKNPISHEQLIETSEKNAYRILAKDLRTRKKFPQGEESSYKFKMIFENPKDITYSAQVKALTEKQEDTGKSLVHIFRKIRVGYWEMKVGYLTVVSNENVDKSIIDASERLNRSTSINNWVANARNNGR